MRIGRIMWGMKTLSRQSTFEDFEEYREIAEYFARNQKDLNTSKVYVCHRLRGRNEDNMEI